MRKAATVIAAAAGVAVVVNLAIYAVGRAAGGSFRFTGNGVVNEVDAATVAGFTAVPLLIGLVLVALLSRFGGWVTRTAVVVAPVLAVVTIFVMTIPADLDTASTVTLALAHLVLAPISVLAVRALARTPRHDDAAPAELSRAQNEA
ncbi:hypothetical protein KOI35_03050 [Actinoplanes bogorensis]|uniref:Uncharacterized protein n=1 Tax=Paractinoplanes bogorensis TaxID=1610840 RepID=A0ABS5YIA8_9ACTN|nr:DUF6069 family protein [Actinoplanes bogorensis]MBU2662478.1 hypothetical protein [Actinoplanes bogorensis]